MAWNNELGRWGEDTAVQYLIDKGYNIVERNWTVGHKEIDIIATDGNVLLFVEVKTRHTTDYGHPAEAVDWHKRRNLLSAMRSYIMTHRVDLDARFDIITVTGTPDCHKIEHLENAVSNF